MEFDNSEWLTRVDLMVLVFGYSTPRGRSIIQGWVAMTEQTDEVVIGGPGARARNVTALLAGLAIGAVAGVSVTMFATDGGQQNSAGPSSPAPSASQTRTTSTPASTGEAIPSAELQKRADEALRQVEQGVPIWGARGLLLGNAPGAVPMSLNPSEAVSGKGVYVASLSCAGSGQILAVFRVGDTMEQTTVSCSAQPGVARLTVATAGGTSDILLAPVNSTTIVAVSYQVSRSS